MYKRYAMILLAVSLLFGMAVYTEESRQLLLGLAIYNEEHRANVRVRIPEVWVVTKEVMKVDSNITGNCPVLEIQSLEKEDVFVLDEDDKMILYKIVEAEAGSEDRIGKILVANVVLNRVRDEAFPDTVEAVVYQQDEGVTQFSPVANGSLETAVPDEDTIEAVDAALAGEDYSQGALFFAAREYADANNMLWFDTALEKVVSHGGHEFYR
ncbi:MAG: cell wall hydrolase [Lachnospiraceae bacterium]|nr:cell wall hydrolase [Lachnospiraceae bacterium]